MSAPTTDPKGFDRSKALPIKCTGPVDAPVYKVYSVSGALLGAFSDQEDAIKFRDTVPLEKAILSGTKA